MHFSDLGCGKTLEAPQAEPPYPRPQGGRTYRAASKVPPRPGTENFMSVLCQEAHSSWLRPGGVGERPARKLLSSFVLGGWGKHDQEVEPHWP